MTGTRRVRQGGRAARLASALAVALALAGGPGTPGADAAATVASDTASPVFRADSAADPAGNRVTCNGSGCVLVAGTILTPYPCAQEVVMIALESPQFLHRDTHCRVTLDAWFPAFRPEGEGSTQCGLLPAEVRVGFTSGVSAVFSGAFTAAATFKPTRVSGVAGNRRVTQGQIVVNGGSRLEDRGGVGAGWISGVVLGVHFPSPGLDASLCYPRTERDGFVSQVPHHGVLGIEY